MAIIIEGIDASGKSTLARIIARRLRLNLVESEGPPKYEGEMDHRVERYIAYGNSVLFVRHPCISQPIYGAMRDTHGDPINEDLLTEFYDQRHFFIYCDPLDRGMTGHKEKGHDSPRHMKAVNQNYNTLLQLYREWAIKHAHVFYRIGDSMERVIDLCSTVK